VRKFTESIYCIEELLEKSDTKQALLIDVSILPGNNKSHEFLVRKRGNTFTPIVLTICILKTPFSPLSL